MGFNFYFSSIMLGVGLAMDAFSVSLANGLNEPNMKNGKLLGIAGIFAAFQFAMPLIGWVCVSTAASYFEVLNRYIPWIALVLLCIIGGNMLKEGIESLGCCSCEKPPVGFMGLAVQGIATSIDALSVGFTIASYNFGEALLACALIGIVTLFICAAGIEIGKKAGCALAGKAGILGGVILIAIGIKIGFFG